MTNSQNPDTPRITIGITCYNAAQSIARAIESALSQNWDNKEIVIVDDVSTDNSVSIIESIAAQNPSLIRLIRHDVNRGAGGARQTIIDNARGDFIAFFDDDDESLPSRIKTQAERIIAYEKQTGQSLIACYASGTRLYPNGYTLPMQAIGSQAQIPHGQAVAGRLLYFKQTKDWFFGAGTPTCSLMARKSTFDAAGGFHPEFRRSEDIDFAIRLALIGGHFIGCPEPLFIQHSTGGGDKSADKNLAAELQLVEKHQEYLKSLNRYFYAAQWPRLRYHHFRKEYGQMMVTLLGLLLRHPIQVTKHFMTTAPKRFLHELKMNQKAKGTPE